jgi:hypothetical protein
MVKLLLAGLAVYASIQPAQAQALDPPPAAPEWDIAWRADIYARGQPPLRNAEVVDFDRISESPFATKRACADYGRSHAGDMATLIAAYMSEADDDVRFTCAPWPEPDRVAGRGR